MEDDIASVKANDFENNFGYSHMLQTFLREGLQPPPIPKSLRSSIFLQGKWCWGTKPVDPLEMYMGSNRYMAELLSAGILNYAAISHAGHGINSYGLQFNLIYGPLVLIIQNTYGGVYNDKTEAIRSISRTYANVQGLLDLLPLNVQMIPRNRVVLAWSEFRGICQYTVLDQTDTQEQSQKTDELMFRGGQREPSSGRAWSSAKRINNLGKFWQQVSNQKILFQAVGKELKHTPCMK